ncbi:uncharacterized protein Z520_08112 [Fonsecaea multimorphosa CBS 102226]|uniref:Glycosylphosphatidylinositol anchor biosynthesis protein 11 n=1 Tax=Fonsecaea multimorphosa CBS 102226 TaxID=1442371 RepID=A0A0D2K0C3_9EURO|nr:uncharacterized protein Z520_08112 [Fonsecaea multimorphosa CBS 102226]KIX96334.1 hypothetical protein Z520_08112 [Fonsecaea multimorphosa CBS 102226]OAL21993.1 hypothetical protein AYO22_07590 [Fonsecaea multimorphosa]
MSTSLTHLLPPTPAQPSSKARLLTPTTHPIPVLSSSLARRFSYIHTALVPLYYYLRASALVADPSNTLLSDLGVVATLQCLFCAICLPPAGSWVSGTPGGPIVEGTASSAAQKSPKSPKLSGAGGAGSLRKKTLGAGIGKSHGHGAGKGGAGAAAGEGGWGARIMPTFFSLILTLTLPPLPLGLIALVLGAPLYPTSLLPLTLLLSVHVSLLGFLPLFYTHGVSSLAWRDVAAAWLPFDSAGVWGATVGSFVGGWVGAIPMALDWDREWQKWPCTVIWGVVMGWTIGRAITNGLGWGVGKRIDLSEKEEPEPASEENIKRELDKTE